MDVLGPSRSRTLAALAALTALALAGPAACKSQPADRGQSSSPEADSAPRAAADAEVAEAGTGEPDAGDEPDDEPDAAGAADPSGATPFTAEVRAAFRVAGCGGDASLVPKHIDPKIVADHCALLEPAYAEYKREWLDLAAPFIAKLRPPGLPKQVVYPFGGGDLVTALATFPDATEITTISLEIAGDVRAIRKATDKRLTTELATLREHLGKLFLKAHSRTANLDLETHEAIPGEVAFTMAALAIHGFEPVTLRYFRFNKDGTLRYLTEADIDKLAEKKKGRGGPFSNAEIRFRKRGEPGERVLRHVAYDLSDQHLRTWPALLAHLEAKGKVSAMTKAASHLLWDDETFSVIRGYLMKHTDWMISDTTGVPPRVAKKSGFVQDYYGVFEWPEPFGSVNSSDAQAFKDAFRRAKTEPIPFYYGYPDYKSHGHIVVTRRAP